MRKFGIINSIKMRWNEYFRKDTEPKKQFILKRD